MPHVVGLFQRRKKAAGHKMTHEKSVVLLLIKTCYYHLEWFSEVCRLVGWREHVAGNILERHKLTTKVYPWKWQLTWLTRAPRAQMAEAWFLPPGCQLNNLHSDGRLSGAELKMFCVLASVLFWSQVHLLFELKIGVWSWALVREQSLSIHLDG